MVEVVPVSSQSRFSKFQEIGLVVEDRGQRIDLSLLLPDFWTIMQAPNVRLHTDPDRKRVIVPTNYFMLPGNIFSFLHEVGHAVDDEVKGEDQLEEELRLRNKFNFEKAGSFTSTERELFDRLVVASERLAWDFALETCLNLRRLGIDLEPVMSEEDLRLHLEIRLLTYTL